MDSRASQIIAELGARPLLEVLRALQREEGCLTEASLQSLADKRVMSLSRLYGIVTSYPEFILDKDRQAERLVSPPVPLPEFLATDVLDVVLSGPLTSRFASPPSSFGDYESAGGMKAIRRAQGEMKPEQVLSEVVLGGLSRKSGVWQRIASAAQVPVIVASAHAGDPAAAQAGLLLKSDPYAVVEGMFVAAVATGANRGFLFLGPVAEEQAGRLAGVAEDVQRAVNINFAVEVLTGPETLVGSEDTVAVACLAGERPVPGPGDPALQGIWGKPTLVDSAECFAAITATLATGERIGSRLYQVSGAVEKPGIFEVDPGNSVTDMLAAAGTAACAPALVGGLSGRFVSGEDLQRPLSHFERTDSPRWRRVHMLGADADMQAAATAMAAYNARYLCGYCIPCRIGAVRMAEMIAAEAVDTMTLRELAWSVEKTGLCAAGRGAAAMVLSAL